MIDRDKYWKRISEVEEEMEAMGFDIVEYETGPGPESRIIFKMSNPGPDYNQVYASTELSNFELTDYQFDMWKDEFLQTITRRMA